MAGEDTDAIGHFVGKWQAREPEMRLAEVFCPVPQKPDFRAWGALLHELREAAFELSDARVTEAKLLWWAEELAGLPQGRHRHPLTLALAGRQAPWSALANALAGVHASDVRAANTEEAVARLLPLALAVNAVEAVLFDSPGSDTQARSLAVHWLLHRLPSGLVAEDTARLPMHLYARHGITPAQAATGEGEAMLRDWAGELLATSPEELGPAALLRRARHRFDRARLARIAAGKGFDEPGALATLWLAWSAGRGA